MSPGRTPSAPFLDRQSSREVLSELLSTGAEFAEVRAVGVPDGGGQQEAASRGIRLALLLDGAISLAGSPC